MGKERKARIPHVPRERKVGGKHWVVGDPAISSSPPPVHLLELLLCETDLPAALHSTRDKHPESKQRGKAAGPEQPGSGAGAARSCPVLPRACRARKGVRGSGTAPHPARAGREVPRGQDGFEVCRTQPGQLS